MIAEVALLALTLGPVQADAPRCAPAPHAVVSIVSHGVADPTGVRDAMSAADALLTERDIRVKCNSRGNIAVKRWVLPERTDTFAEIANWYLRRDLLGGFKRHHVVFADGFIPDAELCGEGGNLFALVTCRDGLTVLHEILHGQGAVDEDAPNSDGQGHCTDGGVMCPWAGSAEILDPGGDDFFNTDPTPGTWLAAHPESNLAHSKFFVKSVDISAAM